MAYGLRLVDGNGTVQIDSDSTNSGILVTSAGSGSTLTNVDLDNELIFARPTTTIQNIEICMENTTGNTWRFRNYAGTNLNVSWIRARWANSYTTPGTGGYGIHIYNSEGELAFDSTVFTGDGGFGVTEYWPTASGNGGIPSVALTGDPVTTDASQYAYMNNAIRDYTDAMNFNIGAWRFQQTTSGGNTVGIYWVGRLSFVIDPGVLNILQQFNVISPEMFFGEGGSV